jgi:glycosyltransferase involved in cell wall biosynthesis
MAPLLLFYDGELAEQARHQGFEVEILLNRKHSLLASARQLALNLARRRVRVIHAHGYKATVYCAIARLWYRFAIVKTEHGLPELMAGRPIQQLRGHFYHWLDNMATGRAVDTVCYVTDELRAHYQKSYSKLRTAVIPNGVAGINRHRFPRPPEFDPSAFNVVIAGRLDTVKGQHFAVDAAAMKGMPRNLHVYIIGTGPCEAALRALAENRGVAERVHFLGFRRNIYDYITHCAALLMPSLHEGLPYTLLEAMALGTPIICSNVGGLSEVMKDEVTALLVPPGDAGALANAIRRLHGNDSLRRRLAEAAQRVQQTKYSLETMTKSYIEVYGQSQLRG